ncbi:hypothetical protein IFM58399_01870 [Aspergillus lentulus]|uniref:uncharacterized protein n=1 Tax=Aspergillus lentulus TaxID=293939 RepID=UPI00139466E1|nr:uncharacterized protein IFM58399_01870 [Aspergillus lentulus]GFF28058.1 hypothetical protein IFM58399_01870 [Aspergillus lentulus]GFF66625.1 hypothetical protein IFM47457_01442 [Aspergillus lentulus]GFG16544.1 hypothetical protein IFM61392_09562 [Aspergillus lentulus]
MPRTGTANPFEPVLPREKRSDPSVPGHISSRLPTTVRLIEHAVLLISRTNNPVHADMDTDMDIVATQKATTGAQSHRSRTQTPAFLKRKHKRQFPAVATLHSPQPSVKTVLHTTLPAQSPVL